VPSEKPHEDIVEEAIDLVQTAESAGLTLRLFGGVAIRVRSPHQCAALARPYKDIDLFAPRRTSRKVSGLFERRGYAQDAQFNAMHGHYRLIFNDLEHARQVDVFVGKFEMCHALPLADRLNLDRYTLPPADLLLTKLQIVELTDKDHRDLLTLFLDHEIGERDEDQMSAAYVASLCAGDWGLWRTVTRNLERLDAARSQYALSEQAQELIALRLRALQEQIARQRKSARWKTRAVVGDRVQWYELPEEVDEE
jgi:hypothetical protein